MVAPKSPTGIATGLAGVVAGVGTIVAIYGWQQPYYLKTLAVLVVAGAVMVATDLGVYRAHCRETTGMAPSPVNGFSPWRVIQKLVAFWATVASIAGIYWLLPEYGTDFYRPFKDAVLIVLPPLLLISPIYVNYVDRRQHQPDDAYVELARLLGGVPPADWTVLRSYARSWLVKGFFLPLMFVFLNGYLSTTWASPLLPLPFADFGSFYEFSYTALLMWDVLLASVGYALTLRAIDAHIRSAEPTIFGWVVCVICYPPFWSGISAGYFAFEKDEVYWGHFLGGIPALHIVWGSIILLLIGVYFWATAAFGTRFSNLTHRGIITNGPYRWVKHPAYLTKNLSWWMISVPFVTSGDWTVALQACLLLLGVNMIYYMRAVTEERHLARDPEYREYQAFIAEHGLWATMKRYFVSTRSSLGAEAPPAKGLRKEE